MEFFRKPTLFMAAVPTFLFFTSLFLMYPLSTQVIIETICGIENSANDDDCTSSKVSELASKVMLYSGLATDIPAFLFVGTYGALADRWGRRAAFFFPILGHLVYTTTFFLVSKFKPSFYLELILAASFFTGCTGSYGTVLMGAFTYLSDISTSKERPTRFSTLESAVFVAQVVGPLAGGSWAQHTGFDDPMLCSAVLSLAALMWTGMMAESLPATSPLRDIPYSFDPLKSLRNLATLFTAQAKIGWTPLPLIFIAFFLQFYATVCNGMVFVLYEKHVLKWGPELIGIGAGLNAFLLVVSMLLLPWLVTALSGLEFHDILYILIGFSGWIFYFITFSFARSTGAALISLCFVVLCGPLVPRTRALIANSVPPTMQTLTQSSFASLQTMVTAFSPAALAVYGATADSMPYLVYWLLAFGGVISAGITLFIIYTPDLKSNLPDLDGRLHRLRMGFQVSEPLLQHGYLGTGMSADDESGEDRDSMMEGLNEEEGDVKIKSNAVFSRVLVEDPDASASSSQDQPGPIENRRLSSISTVVLMRRRPVPQPSNH